MKILVTGGGGFIGAWIVRTIICGGHTPVVLDRADDRRKVVEIAGSDIASGLEWIATDIADTDAVVTAAKGCHRIIHLAGLLTPACKADPVLGARVNLIGTLNAFLAARAHGMPSVVYMSSAGVFGPDGNAEPHPVTLYGAFKLASEHSARAFMEDSGIASIGFRPYVVYGPGRDGGLSAGPTLACRAAARGEAYTMPITGAFDMIHVKDVAAAFLDAVRMPLTDAHVVNLIGHRATAEEVVSSIRNAVPGARIDCAGEPIPIDSPRSDAALETLFPRWTPIGVDDGLRATIDFYRETL
ncbi:NAD-dependent epimerase/dehydratase family protein [Mesorhizobium xinjiangense]|uniref:NAD-dependent epimerase/dehydratase family protein n=1 Tax=Mesorhizobium xinjiangense TaxID=2678685 RepID=UPI0012ECC6C8|nr:SDR family oxidoreductase [Mesorhizobium xinjiangense]